MSAHDARRRTAEWIAVVCLLGAATLWGSSFSITKIAVASASPSLVTFLRCVIAAVLLGAYAVSRAPACSSTDGDAAAGPGWKLWALACGVATGVAFLTTAIGMQHVDSSIAGIPTATMPAWTMLFAGVMGVERVSSRHLVSIGVGTVALAMLALPSEGRWALGGLAALAIAALAHAWANLASHVSMRGNGPAPVAALSLAAAALVTLPGVLVSLPVSVPSGSSLLAILALAALPSAAAYVMYFHAIDVLGATRSSLVTYVIPPLALVAGVLFMGERVDWVVAIALLLAMVALVIGLGEPRAPAPVPASTEPLPLGARTKLEV